jgi:hypothetical protein
MQLSTRTLSASPRCALIVTNVLTVLRAAVSIRGTRLAISFAALQVGSQEHAIPATRTNLLAVAKPRPASDEVLPIRCQHHGRRDVGAIAMRHLTMGY